ncbi:hypothetical protein PF008_g4021 [Phytophthora fragariae]|uniref:Argonaute linker 1 domain-containing protein n=1 Tax=Phytophthora fragariae TaxID=53985 RepID=A0A6G0SCH8_9STRA|nr:hypothetical protein PF008_g4021 [Phytophthora fragariae]
MTTYDPLDFHGGYGYGSSWPSEDFGYERDRGYGRSSRATRYESGYGGGHYDAQGYGSYDHRRSSYGEDGRGGYEYERSVRYEHRGRDSGYGGSAFSGGAHDDYHRSEYNDGGYGTRSHEYGGSSRYDDYSRANDDRGYGRHAERADRGDRDRSGGDYGDHRYRTRRGERGRREGRRSDHPREGSGAGLIPGSGYEEIGDAITDPHRKAEWSGSAGVRNVQADDPDVLKKVEFCARPQTRGRSGRTVPLKVNYFGVEIASGPNQIFKYHVTVERSIDRDEEDKYGPQRGGQDGREHAESGTDATPQPEQRPERPLQRALMSVVVNTVLRQNNDEFAGIRVVHDGMAAIYSPVKLPWTSKTSARTVGRLHPRRLRLLEHYSDPSVNVMPVLQALDVVVRHLACQRLTVVGRDLYTLKDAHTLHGGKELCWGYHQAIRKAEAKLVLNLNETSAIFYTPGPLMQLVLSTLRIKDPRNARSLSEAGAEGSRLCAA